MDELRRLMEALGDATTELLGADAGDFDPLRELLRARGLAVERLTRQIAAGGELPNSVFEALEKCREQGAELALRLGLLRAQIALDLESLNREDHALRELAGSSRLPTKSINLVG